MTPPATPDDVEQERRDRDARVAATVREVRALVAENRRVGSDLERAVERLSEEYGLDDG